MWDWGYVWCDAGFRVVEFGTRTQSGISGFVEIPFGGVHMGKVFVGRVNGMRVVGVLELIHGKVDPSMLLTKYWLIWLTWRVRAGNGRGRDGKIYRFSARPFSHQTGYVHHKRLLIPALSFPLTFCNHSCRTITSIFKFATPYRFYQYLDARLCLSQRSQKGVRGPAISTAVPSTTSFASVNQQRFQQPTPSALPETSC